MGNLSSLSLFRGKYCSDNKAVFLVDVALGALVLLAADRGFCSMIRLLLTAFQSICLDDTFEEGLQCVQEGMTKEPINHVI